MTRSLLVLEDDPMTRILYKKILQEYDAVIVGTIDEALVKLSEKKFDLCVIDLLLEGDKHGGMYLAKLINSPVLLATAIELNPKLMEYYKNYIRKPFRAKEFLLKIEEVLNENYSVSQGVE